MNRSAIPAEAAEALELTICRRGGATATIEALGFASSDIGQPVSLPRPAIDETWAGVLARRIGERPDVTGPSKGGLQ